MDKDTRLLIFESYSALNYAHGRIKERVLIMHPLHPETEDAWRWLQSIDHTINKLKTHMKETGNEYYRESNGKREPQINSNGVNLRADSRETSLVNGVRGTGESNL